MNFTEGDFEKIFEQPQIDKFEDKIFNMTKNEKKEISEWEAVSGNKVPWH